MIFERHGYQIIQWLGTIDEPNTQEVRDFIDSLFPPGRQKSYAVSGDEASAAWMIEKAMNYDSLKVEYTDWIVSEPDGDVRVLSNDDMVKYLDELLAKWKDDADWDAQIERDGRDGLLDDLLEGERRSDEC